MICESVAPSKSPFSFLTNSFKVKSIMVSIILTAGAAQVLEPSMKLEFTSMFHRA